MVAQYCRVVKRGQATGVYEMSMIDNAGNKAFGQIAPKFAQLSDEVLFSDIWQRSELPARERSLITVAALVALNRKEQLSFHLPFALENGVSHEELTETITHLAFYAGWPVATTALQVLATLPTN